MHKLHLKTLLSLMQTQLLLFGSMAWKQANDDPHMIFLAPEQLLSKEFSELVKDGGMLMLHTCILAVDEAHLLNTWGTGFRKAYHQIGWVCSHLHNVVLLGTVNPAAPVFHLFSLRNPDFIIYMAELRVDEFGMTFLL